MVYPIEQIQKCRVKSCFEDQTDQIGPPQTASLLAGVGVQVRALVHRHVLTVPLLAVLNMSHHHQRRAGDEDQLQRPQTDVGDGEDAVVANIGAARLEKERGGDDLILNVD